MSHAAADADGNIIAHYWAAIIVNASHWVGVYFTRHNRAEPGSLSGI